MEILHFIGFCPDNKFHVDLLDIILPFGFLVGYFWYIFKVNLFNIKGYLSDRWKNRKN